MLLLDRKPELLMHAVAKSTGKLYSILPEDGSGDFVVNRNGQASYFDKNRILKIEQANVPRLTFNQTTGEFKGVLIENSSTNLLIKSEDINSIFWFKQSSIVTQNDTISPDGNQTADLWIPNISSTDYYLLYNNTPFILESNTFFTAYIKSSGMRYFTFGSGINDHKAIFDFQTETISNQTGNQTNLFFEKLKNGWYRVGAFRPFSGNITMFASNSETDRIGDGINGVYIWGCQLEVKSSPTSYIPTNESQVTRPSDVITVITPDNVTEIRDDNS
jgi:hypothetical protein